MIRNFQEEIMKLKAQLEASIETGPQGGGGIKGQEVVV